MYHPEECLSIEFYRSQYEAVDDRLDAPHDDPVECLLCEYDVTTDADRFGDVARALVDDCTEDRLPDRPLNPLRTLGTATERRLYDAGYLDQQCGAETTRLPTWQDRRETATDRHRFEFLLRDAIEVHLLFYREDRGYDSDAAFVSDYADVDDRLNCPRNVTATWRWLQAIDAPTEFVPIEERFETYDHEVDIGDEGEQAGLERWSA